MVANASPNGSRGIQSVENALQVLDALIGAGKPLALGELAARAHMPPSKAHRYLASLQRGGLVRQDPVGSTYDLGAMALRLGAAAFARVDQIANAAACIQELAHEVNLTAMLNVWGEMGPTIIRIAHSARPCVTSLSLGSVLPVLRSATGRIFLAFLPPAVTRAAIDRELALGAKQLLHPHDTPSRKEIDDQVAQAGKTLLAGVDGQVIPGLRAIASPILNAQGEACAVVTLIDAHPDLALVEGAVADRLKTFCAGLSV